jgi:hypothetical protein
MSDAESKSINSEDTNEGVKDDRNEAEEEPEGQVETETEPEPETEQEQEHEKEQKGQGEEKSYRSHEMESFLPPTLGSAYDDRFEVEDDEEEATVPVSVMKEGFHRNSPDPTYDDRFRYEEDKLAWLRDMHNWRSGNLGPMWTGERVLGEGGYGIAGQWRYNGDDSNIPKYIVVKEGTDGNQSLRREARFLELLSPRTGNILRIYGRLHSEPRRGGWADNGENLGRNTTLRMITEYCNGGDMAAFTDDPTTRM